MGSALSQSFPPAPTFTEKQVEDLSTRVYIVTGSNTGVGKELAQILYSKNAVVYVAARSEKKAAAAIADIRNACPRSKGRLEHLSLDLADLKSVAKAAKEFCAKESRLDVLFNNAGVMHPEPGSTTTQGYEMQLGVNNLGHVLFTELLTPVLAQTASAEKAGKVRVIWVSSLYAEVGSPKGGFDPNNIDYSKKDESKYFKYSASKAGVYYQGTEYARRHKAQGIVSVPLNPGNLKSDLQRHHGSFSRIFGGFLLHPAINGAYTELFAGLSPQVALEKSGSYIVPWGRFSPIRSDLEQGSRPASEGGTGMAEKWYNWCLEQVRPFVE